MHAVPPISEHDRLKQLLWASWSLYDRLHDQGFVVRPAIPILFFGDSNRYYSSPLRVVTVGLNPSRDEFPGGDQLGRFPVARAMVEGAQQRDRSRHLDALNAYFRTKPYSRWFASFEPILNGLDASYYDGHANTALHTDLCSPIATDPTWSGLSKDQRSLLASDGVTIWHSLSEILAPHVILVSIAQQYLKHIKFPVVGPPRVLWELNRGRPYQVLGKLITITSSKPTILASGRAARTPFGTVSTAHKREIGAAIKEWYDAAAG